jgi:hypothetical protein
VLRAANAHNAPAQRPRRAREVTPRGRGARRQFWTRHHSIHPAMDLFGDLPAPKAAPRPEEGAPEPPERPEKRQRVEDEVPAPAAGGSGGGAAGQGVDAGAARGDAPAAPPPQEEAPPHGAPQEPEPAAPAVAADQVGPALLRIANHISSAAKFAKAAGLLRQLIGSGALAPTHRAELFAALRAAYADPGRADEPALRREYRRLLNAFANGVPPDVLSPAQGAHLEVYSIWTMQRAELATDDSFAFNKVRGRARACGGRRGRRGWNGGACAARQRQRGSRARVAVERGSGPCSVAPRPAPRPMRAPLFPPPPPQAVARLKEDIAALGPTSEAEEAAARGLQLPGGARVPAVAAGGGGGAGLSAAGGADEADPFGLDDFLKQQEEGQGAAAAAAGAVPADPDAPWSEAELSVMRRQALLDCVAAAKKLHKLAWARVSGRGGGRRGGRGRGHERTQPALAESSACFTATHPGADCWPPTPSTPPNPSTPAQTSVEMLVEAAHGCIANFVAPQRAVLEEDMRWVKAERAARRSGAARGAGGGKEMTSFEKARAEWANAAVSRYGKVGGAGDAKSTHWLG